MVGASLWRRKLLAGVLASDLAGIAGCLGGQGPAASRWAAGIRWGDPPGEVSREMGFSPRDGGLLGPANSEQYLRVNDGELVRLFTPTVDDSVPAGRGDHVEFVIDFDTLRRGRETVFEYTIPDDDDLVGVLAGFAECLHYRGTDEWVVRPLNVEVDTDFLGRQKETLVVQVERERRDKNPDWYVWGHNESVREELQNRADEDDREFDIKYLKPGEQATFAPATYHRVRMEVTDGAERVARVSYPEPGEDS